MSTRWSLVLLLLAAPLLAQDADVRIIPGSWGDSFDDGVIAGEFSPVGGASLRETGGQLVVATSLPFDGVRVVFPSASGPEPVFAYCAMVGFDVAQLEIGRSVVFRVFDPQVGEVFARADEKEKVRWEITKVNDTTYNYKVYKDGKLVASGQARIPAGSKGFRIDKVPGTNMIIGEVILKDGRWEKLWEKDPPPPELPFTAIEILSDQAQFALDDVMGGPHTDNPNTVGATGDLEILPVTEGGLVFHPLGANRFDVDVTFEDVVLYGGLGEQTIPLALEVGGQTTAVEVQCRGTGTGTCSGTSSCDTKTCPDREYDIGDGNGYRAYTGTCKFQQLGLSCGCSYTIKKTFSGITIPQGQTVTARIDAANLVPELVEGANAVSAEPTRRVFAAPQVFYCGGLPRGIAAGTTPPPRAMMLQTVVRVAGVGQVLPGSVQLLVSSATGLAGPFAPVGVSTQGTTAYLSFFVPPDAGLVSQPQRLVLVGASSSETGGVTFWNAETDARVIGDEEIRSQASELIHQLGTIQPSVVELGTPTPAANTVSDQLVAMGDMALPALVSAFDTGTRLEQAWSAFAAGAIGNPTAAGPLSALAYELSLVTTPSTEDFTALGAVRQALTDLTVAVPIDVDLPPADKRCCVTDIDAVTDGNFQGGKKAKDYYPDLAAADGTSPYWGGDGSKGGSFDKGNRIGALVQIVGTMQGDRACCKLTQSFVIEESNYPGAGQPYGDSAAVGKRIDDIAKSGRDASKPPFRQDIGANQSSMADPMSRGYGPTSTFKRVQRFETCFESYAASKPPCDWAKCCVTWVVRQEVRAGKVIENSVTKVGSFCE